MAVTDREIAAVIRQTFPKHTKACYSMAKRTRETGVMLCPEAKRIKEEYLAQRKPRKPENRKFKFRICGRIPDELAVRVQAKMAEQKLTMQDLLLSLLTEWVFKEEDHAENP